ncbi:hypothetical protein [Campylobacter concisus]|uniref:hypothetical protein n=1 Tax=Campylobacter concisus TaxID=199 RepID=UPI000CD852F7|nr:hypothetical protein [Campylobacter concisus]
MNRIQTIKEALGVNETQALITAELLKPLKDEDIIPFFAYRTSFIQPKQSSELITKNAVAAFRKQKALEAIRDGKFSFKNIEQLVEFVKTFFRNERLCYGTVYKDFVIIGVDEYGNLINHYQINQAGKPVQLSSDSEAEVYAWLFENQKRIGVIKYVSEREVKEKEKEQAKIEVANNANLLPADPDAPIKMSDEARARLRLGLSAIAINIAKRA